MLYVSSAWSDLSHRSSVWSQLTYGVLAWEKGNVACINKVQSAQYKSIRIMFRSFDKNVYHLNNLLRMSVTVICFNETILWIKSSISRETLFISRIEKFQTNHDNFTRNQNIVPPRIKKSKCYNAFFYITIRLWNILP